MVIPTYNRAAAVDEAVRSVLVQSVPAAEVIVVDDGSTDETPRVAAGWPSPVRYVRQDNGGVSRARNRGIESATGEWVAFLDSDDTWLPRRLADLAAAVGRFPAAVASAANGRLSDTARPTLEGRPLPWAGDSEGLEVIMVSGARAVLCQPTTSGVAVRRDVLTAVGGFDPCVREFEDLDLVSRVATHGPWTFTHEPAWVLERGNMGEHNVSHQYWRSPAGAMRSLENCHRRALRGGRPTWAEAARLRAKISGYCGNRAALTPAPHDRRRALWQALRAWPTPRNVVRVAAVAAGWRPPMAHLPLAT